MSDETKKNLALMAALQTHAVHTMLEGMELMADARFIAAAYISRAAKILATLRVRGLTDRDEIEEISEHMTLMAMDDKNAGTVNGQDADPPSEKKVH